MAKRDESHAEIDWASAEVSGAKLTAPLEGEASKAWAARVGEVIDRLATHGGWGEIEVGREQLTVADVQPGSEADLRHLLDSAVMQANADFAPEEEPAEEDGTSEADEEMTQAFRDGA
jgi:hypothetical protein